MFRFGRSVAALCAAAAWAAAAEMPRVSRANGRADLVVDGKPWIVLGGELRNSSSSTLEFLAPIWPHLEALHVNTVFAPVSWKLLEPREGEYEFGLVDGMIREARARHLRLALLWMGTWKNGVSGYAPGWVMTNPDRFPRMSSTALSPFGDETWKADARAFAALMRHLREADSARTVVLAQVENEIGVGSPSRDRSAAAEAAFLGPVPARLLRELAKHETQLKPYLRDLWQRNGRRMAGSWTEVFGVGPETDDVFMAWSYAEFVERVAAAGKMEYPLPMYVNACQLKGPTYQAGADPSGGPTDGVLDVWMAGAPSIDFFAVDAYQKFKTDAAAYRHRGNPLVVPECCSWYRDDPYSGPAKAFYAIGEQHALAISPFGIDNRMYRDHLLGLAYRKLAEVTPAIVAARGTGRLHGFYRSAGEKGETFAFEGYRVIVSYRDAPHAAGELDRYGSFGLVVQIAADDFLVSGRGFTARFESADPARTQTVNLSTEEGGFRDAEWRVRRYLNGDEVGGQGAETVLTPAPYSAQPVLGEEQITTIRLRMARIPAVDRNGRP